ncbi:Na(+)/H(+) antiporter subunit D [Microbaculum marinum]|uniref:Na(+)/H(+) antiporter subunit D n=1 Tax=Microbaculum marinum TaxID=1764581 RepID=A0AAW9RQV8_9HYPH
MTVEVSPGLILILGALVVPLLRGIARSVFMLALPVVAFLYLLWLPNGAYGGLSIFDLDLTTIRVDGLSRMFGYVFLIAAFLGVVFALHLKDTVQHVAGLFYPGAAVAAIFAGDLVTLFVFWELTAMASVFLIWASRNENAIKTGIRYLVIHVGSGVLLLAGAAIHYQATGSIAFEHIGLGTTAGALILAAFGIKAAFPFVHGWVPEAYPTSTVTGAVIMSAFTTKLAIYALARGYAGTDLLIPIGAAMAVFPLFYAVIENDLRRVLAYGLVGQLGFMVVGIGIGTELALNGAVAHAFCSVLYTVLLFMSMGAVLYRTGTAKASDLGGLVRSMPLTAGFGIVGAASISAFPLFSGFVSKAMIISAALGEDYFWTWLVLLFASAGAFLQIGLKVPYTAFFGRDSGIRCEEAPPNMLAAMGLASVLCIGIGVLPMTFYELLPYPGDYAPYTLEHVVTQLQLLMFSALAFAVLLRRGLYPVSLKSMNLDFEWVYRRAAPTVALAGWDIAVALRRWALGAMFKPLSAFLTGIYRHHGPDGILARTWPTGLMALWTTLLLAAWLVIYYVQ